MNTKLFNYVFGPVASRRLGLSLGIDLIPYKTCTLDCIYCQIGRTTHLTSTPEPFVPVDKVLWEVSEKLKQVPTPDFITLSGSGEPTLYSHLGELLQKLKRFTIPTAVLTNSTLLYDPKVASQLLNADLVCPSLDAATPSIMEKVNQPVKNLDCERIIEGIIRFSEIFTGKLWLEILLVKDVNDSNSEIAKLVRIAKQINPDRIQLNTVVRPPAISGIRGLDQERLKKIAQEFNGNVEIVATEGRERRPEFKSQHMDIIDLLSRHPSTLEDISSGLGISVQDTKKQIEKLKSEHKITKTLCDQKEYFSANPTQN